MKISHPFQSHFRLVLLAVFLVFPLAVSAQDRAGFAGSWIINRDLSDNTDKQVAKALKAMGEKINGCLFNCKEDRFRGGPEEQELYDHISYDKTLTLTLEDPAYMFVYDDNYRRPVYTDGRSQSVSLNALDEVRDFSMGHWEGNRLLVEARPRDGGFANETYSLIDAGEHLKAELYIRPGSFSVPVEITRIYNKVITTTKQQR